jgi:release factor glutamine methyltransferase
MTIMNTLSIYHIIQPIIKQLEAVYSDAILCEQYAWWMLEAITQQTKASLLSQSSISLTEVQKQQLNNWITQQVTEHIPLQYLLGSVPFGDCTIQVKPPILIPRPETEEWCLALIDKLKALPHHTFSILDLCTGSGCIAIALAKAFPHATIYATDISQKALELAQQNAALNHVTNIIFLTSDIFKAIPKDCSFDIIVSNPPYISHTEWKKLDQSVRNWEDQKALIASQNGTAILKNIINNASFYLNPQSPLIHHAIPQLIVEIGHTQSKHLKSFFYKAGFSDTVIKKDLYGNDRIAVGYLHATASKS